MISMTDLSALRTRADWTEFLLTRFSNDAEAAVKALDAGLTSILRIDLRQARDYVRRTDRLFALLPEQYRPRRIGMEARLLHFGGRHRQALSRYLQARSLFQKQREFHNVARLNRVLAEVYMYLGRYREALDAGRRAVRYFERKKCSADAAQSMVNVGNVYHRMDNNRMALRYYDRARGIFAERGGAPLAIVDYNRANILTNMFQLAEAGALYEGAAEIYASAGMRIPETLCRYSIAYLLFLDGRYTDALTGFERVLATFEQVGDERSAAVTRLDLAELNLQLNQYSSAVSLATGVVDVFGRLGMTYEEGKARFFAALGQLSLGDTRECSRSLARAQKTFARERNELWLGMVHFARCRLLMVRGRFADAARESTVARKLFVRSRDERRAVDADIAHLAANLKVGRRNVPPRRAARLLASSLTKFQEFNVQRMLGEFHYNRGDYVTALNHLRPAIDAVERMASQLHYDDIRHFFLVDKLDAYSLMMRGLLKLKRTDDAFVSNLSALSLVNSPSVSSQLRSEIPVDLTTELDQLRRSLQQYQHFPRSGQRLGTSMVKVRNAEQDLWGLERRARASVTTAGVSRLRLATDANEVRGNMAPGETLVSYTMAGGRAGAFVVSNKETAFVRLDVDETDMRADVRKLHFLFESTVHVRGDDQGEGAAVAHLLATLYGRLFAPLESRLTGDRLIVLADELFAEVPFGALGSGDDSVCRQFDLRLIVDPGQIIRRQSEPTDWESRSHAVFSVSSPALPAADEEAREIAELFTGARLLSGGTATCNALRRELAQADGIVHIATHASRSSENPLFSRMLMSDGPFFPFDLFGTGVTAQLTTLSGCQTAAPGLNYGNSFSLARAFYQAGSRYVLASLWPVSDSLTRMFMVEFYGSLKRGQTVPLAYNAAVETLRAQMPTVAYWGSFVLLGL